MTCFAISTLGCKVNAYESEGYIQSLLDKGYEEVPFKEKADIYIINTCAVTNAAAGKSRQRIHQAHARNPEAIIAVVGCYAQSHCDLEASEHVDILIGSDGKRLLPQMIEHALKKREFQKHIINVRESSVFESLPIQRFHHQTRAYLKVQDGCNQFCSYCIIPYTRGKERSLPLNEAIQIARDLVANGHQEIVLSGIHTGRYGRDLNISLRILLQEMLKIVGLKRIRISSIELNEIDDELLQLIKEEPRIARHLHIPIQSGSDAVLKKMGRPYDVAALIKRIGYIRQTVPGISISSDVIVGFPQESEEDFTETCVTIQKMKLSFLHVFPYSRRDHTKAAEMSGHLSNVVKKERAARLAALSKNLYNEYKSSFLQKEVQILFEKMEDGYVFGHTSEYLPVYVKGTQSLLHTMRNAVITEYSDDRLTAVLKEE
ncbi:MAG: tRNA (N(6)-L-threonylcarbamoyladenosine(37)-C(2))-methylthiotransferase MtaB [Erysipelotrichaceae bacterium]|jgi:threonylcarbamoyladenosine tRNA methylthiotransferase MtaB|nr:tRNA (N(6)-L-threonylcarbamoyladenosine(37)-C(2))-methylthiotransferase MtaB [Erysipelotrichaceae bacterium]